MSKYATSRHLGNVAQFSTPRRRRSLLASLKLKWERWRCGEIDRAVGSICESLERRILANSDSSSYAPLAQYSFEDGKTSDSLSKVTGGSITAYYDTSFGHYYKSGVTITLTGTNGTPLPTGRIYVTFDLLTANNYPDSNGDLAGQYTVTGSGTGATNRVEAFKNMRPDYIAPMDNDQSITWGSCRQSIPDNAYRIEYDFANSDTQTATINIGVTGLSPGSTGAQTFWGIDSLGIGLPPCDCGGGGGYQSANAGGDIGGSTGSPGTLSNTGAYWTSWPGSAYSGSSVGNNVVLGQQSYLLNEGSTVIAVDRGSPSWFDQSGTSTTYNNRMGGASLMLHTNNEFVIRTADGAQTHYYDFSTNWASTLQGKIRSEVVPVGADTNNANVIVYNYNATNSNQLDTIVQTSPNGDGTFGSQKYQYEYLTSGSNSGKIKDIVLWRRPNNSNTSYTPWHEVLYDYYDGSTAAPSNPHSLAYGNLGDLMSVKTLDVSTGTNSAQLIDGTYLRYFSPSGTNNAHGYIGGLEYEVGPQSLARMQAAGLDPLTANVNDSDVRNYADGYYEYDPSSHQITLSRVQGGGASADGGFGKTTYSYFDNTSTNGAGAGYTGWSKGSVKTFNDGSSERDYYNSFNQLLLGVFSDPSGNRWGTYYQYDGKGRAVATYNPSAVALPSNLSDMEQYPDLVHWQNGRAQYLRATSGLANITDYYASTDGGLDDTSNSGGVANYTQDTTVARGQLAAPMPTTGVTHTHGSTTSTITTASAHGFTTGDVVTLSGSLNSVYNGTFTATVSGTNTFQISFPSDPGDSLPGPYLRIVDQVTQEKWTYFDHNDGSGNHIYPVATDTRYRYADLTGAQMTSYTYGWYSNSLQMLSQTVTRPPITSDQNGPASSTSDTGNADTITTFYDQYGRPSWVKDGDGYISYTAYDPQSGALVKTIADVNTTNTADFSNLPSGWTSTNHTALHLITTYAVDASGRTTKVTDPKGNLIVTVYNDASHEVRTYRGYMTGTSFVEIGPTSVQREDRSGSYTESLTYVATPNLDGTTGLPNGTETYTNAASIRTLSRTRTTAGGQVDETDNYFTLGTGTNAVAYAQGAGTFQLKISGTTNVASSDFYATTFGYDTLGNQSMVKNPLGTITHTVYDSLGRQTSIWIGTNDQPGTNGSSWTPSNQGTNSNMVKVTDNYYDTYDPTVVGIGDGNLTRTVSYPFGTTTSTLRVTENFNDWRNRLVASKVGVLLDSSNRFANSSAETGQTGTNAVHRPITYYTYDNLDEVTQVDTYDGDGVSLSGTNGVVVDGNGDGVPDAPSQSYLRARVSTKYDDQGRQYETDMYDVQQVTQGTTTAGTIIAGGNTIKSSAWYDHRGDLMAQAQPGGGAFTKDVYDGAGRLATQYTTDGGWLNNGSSAATTWSNASNVAGDIVLQQVETVYDAASNPVLITTRQRFHNDATNSAGSGLGDLRDPSNNPKARVSFQSVYYDHANRQTDFVDWGTLGGTNNGSGTSVISLSSAPTRSGTALATTIAYNDSGWTDTVTDPRGIVTSKNYYDMLGRQTRTVSAFVDPGTNTLQTATDHNQITDYTYDGLDHIVTQMAWVNNNGTNNVFQTTKYIYGVTTSTSGINDNDLLLQIQYPDKTTGNPNTNSAYTETYAYDALGEMTKKTQRTNSIHQYSHDVLGRMTSDNVITLGGGVSGSVRREDYSFDTGGRLYQATSYSNTNGTTVVNQVQRDYNGVGQITREWQAHSGTVNVNAGTSQTMSVQYTYSEMTGGANHSRLTGIVYPYGNRTVTYDYSGNGGLDDIISRLSALTQTIGTNAATTLESYDYLGLGTVVAKHHPQNGIDLTYEQQAGDTSVVIDGGDQYTGLDRFGRILDQNWLNTGTAGGSTDRFQYAYDANNNVQYKNNLVSSTFSELYHGNATATAHSYDNLNRLTDFRRGTLSASGGGGTTLDTVATLNTLSGSSKNWNLDAQGNWSSVTTGGSTQNRTANQENQYTVVGGTSLSYDSDGNLTSNENGDTQTYDAWDRLAHFTHRAGGGSVGWDETDNNIDALGRRVQVVTTGFNYCVATPSDDLYYSIDWQVLEDDNSTALNGGSGSGFNRMQFVWSPTYVNDLVLRDRDPNGTGNFSERLYVQQDGDHNVTAITNTSGTIQERFVYDPYGSVATLTSAWATTTDSKNWLYLFQGGRWDSYVGLYTYQRRELDPTLGRWIEQDPQQYVDGASLYQFVASNPLQFADPGGLWKLNRNGVALANAMTAQGDTIAALAGLTGLEVDEWKKWLTLPGNIRDTSGISIPPSLLTKTTPLCKDQKFKVPNTVVSSWSGELGVLGRMFVDYNADVQTFRDRGFFVVKLSGVTAAQFEGTLQALSAAKLLHGFFFWGHGIEDSKSHKYLGVGTDADNQDYQHQSLFSNWHLSYKPAFGIFYCCGGLAAKDLFSSGPGSVFWGIGGTLVPVPFHLWGPPPSSLIPPGAQGTPKTLTPGG